MPATPADVWRVYVKPSMGGIMVIRKKTVNRRSERVRAINKRLQDLPKEEMPAVKAKNECLEYLRRKYPDREWKHCPMKLFRYYLRKYMKQVVGRSAG